MNKVASCGPNQVFSQGLCYPKCRDDWTGSGATCSQNCPKTGEFLNLGPLCQKKPVSRGAGSVPYLEPCPSGYIDNGRDCIQQQVCQWPNQCQGSGLPTIEFKDRQQCPRDTQELSQGFCYKKCPKGQTGVAGECWPNCPPGFIDTGPGTQGQNCVKPTQGRGLGVPPSKTPLSIISQSPNGSTLLERYRQGQSVAQTAANTNSNQMGSPTLGDPKNNKSNASSLINSVWSTGSLISQGLGGKVLGSVGFGSTGLQATSNGCPDWVDKIGACGIWDLLADSIKWVILAIVITFALPFLIQVLQKAIEGQGKIVGSIGKGIGEATAGISQGFGVAIKGAEVGLGSAIKGAEVGLGSAIQGAQAAGTGILSESFRNVGQLGSAVIQGASQLAQTSAQELTKPVPQLQQGIVTQGNLPPATTTVSRIGYIQGGWSSQLQ